MEASLVDPGRSDVVTTRLIHWRGQKSEDWWRSPVICDLPGSVESDDLKRLQKLLHPLAHMGFEAVLLRSSSAEFDRDLPGLRGFIEEAHRQDLKVLLRVFWTAHQRALDPLEHTPILSPDHAPEGVADKVRVALSLGVDGVDLGWVEEDEGAPAREATFTRTVRQALAELAEGDGQTILGAAVSGKSVDHVHQHLSENWVHHLRTDSLISSPWQAHELHRAVRKTYGARDPLGHAIPLRFGTPTWAEGSEQDGEDPGSWAYGAPAERSLAMTLFYVSLPGAVYIPFLYAGGQVRPQQPSAADSPSKLRFRLGRGRRNNFAKDTVTHALKLRETFGLRNTNLAFISSLPWADETVAVHSAGSVLVVLNTGGRSVTVPGEHQLLLSSNAATVQTFGGTVVAPETCAWFRTASPNPVDPAAYR